MTLGVRGGCCGEDDSVSVRGGCCGKSETVPVVQSTDWSEGRVLIVVKVTEGVVVYFCEGRVLWCW